MKLSIPQKFLEKLLIKQVDNLFLLETQEHDLIKKIFSIVLDRCEYCFSHSDNKYYSKDGVTYFNPFHSGQYSIFLYYFSNESWIQGNSLLADKIYFLNKTLNACDLFYQVNLPRIFMLDHPVGSVMGRANYSDFFSFGQNCTVGNNKGVYPTLGKHVRMCANSMIIGDCTIGSNVTLGANACVKDEDIEANTIVFGSSPNLILKKK